MNKKIKVIELLNRIHQNKDIPKRLKKNAYIFEYCEEEQDFYDEKHSTFLVCDYAQSHSKWLDVEIEILEDEEEIDIQNIEIFEQPRDLSIWSNDTLSKNQRNIIEKVNKLVKAVKQLDKKINKED